MSLWSSWAWRELEACLWPGRQFLTQPQAQLPILVRMFYGFEISEIGMVDRPFTVRVPGLPKEQDALDQYRGMPIPADIAIVMANLVVRAYQAADLGPCHKPG